MSDAVLRHGRLPFIDASEQRLGSQAKNLLQFIAYDANKLVVGERPDMLRIRSSKKATQQGAVFRSAVRKFVVHESRRQQELAFAAGYKKSEARGKRLADLAIVAKADGDRGAVLRWRRVRRKARGSRCEAQRLQRAPEERQ